MTGWAGELGWLGCLVGWRLGLLVSFGLAGGLVGWWDGWLVARWLDGLVDGMEHHKPGPDIAGGPLAAGQHDAAAAFTSMAASWYLLFWRLLTVSTFAATLVRTAAARSASHGCGQPCTSMQPSQLPSPPSQPQPSQSRSGRFARYHWKKMGGEALLSSSPVGPK